MNRFLPLFMVFLVPITFAASSDPASYDGFNNAKWGIAPEAVRQAAGAGNWQSDGNVVKEFPKELGISAFKSTGDIAGYKAVTTYYFWNNRFFQATVKFNFDDLKKYDFNYLIAQRKRKVSNLIIESYQEAGGSVKNCTESFMPRIPATSCTMVSKLRSCLRIADLIPWR